MAQPEASDSETDLIDVLEAARLAGRSAETIRRWIWAGRLPTQRQGRRHVMRKDDILALSGMADRPATLAAWTSMVRSAAEGASGASGQSAADLVLEDRRFRSAIERP
jgi:helix-turn-helix protein